MDIKELLNSKPLFQYWKPVTKTSIFSHVVQVNLFIISSITFQTKQMCTRQNINNLCYMSYNYKLYKYLKLSLCHYKGRIVRKVYKITYHFLSLQLILQRVNEWYCTWFDFILCLSSFLVLSFAQFIEVKLVPRSMFRSEID